MSGLREAVDALIRAYDECPADESVVALDPEVSQLRRTVNAEDEPVSPWRPIEEAPRDGMAVHLSALVETTGGWPQVLCRWDGEIWVGWAFRTPPTHFAPMLPNPGPLPAPPQQGEA